MPNRRGFMKGLAGAVGAAALGSLAACAGVAPSRARAHVVVVGGGFGGATAAKYLRMWSQGEVDVTLVERNASFVSCPISNLVVGGYRELAGITASYAGLQSKWGVRLINDEATAIDAGKRTVSTAASGTLSYDRLVLSPGIDFLPNAVPGLEGNFERIPHAWKAGPQTVLLRRQLQDMADGGVFVLHIPKAPFRCPPGPYERACVVASYLRRHKPRSKVLVLDANGEIQSKKALFAKVFEGYGGLIEYVPNSELRSVDAATRSAELEFDRIRADVLNVIPPMRAGTIATKAGLPLSNGRWVDVDWLTMEAKGVAGVHVLGDALQPAPAMPKSGHMANQHAKVAAAAILNLLAGEAPNPAPVVMNTCYSFVDDRNVIHIASVHQYDAAKRQPIPVEGAGGLSTVASEAEGRFALAWAKNIWADMLA
ncbi:NAD(P)/FAD-dependent oxidoreductase [Thauera sinica]|uniref:FCSD flavin-binding domain-containing protein n=1 Tax=Thauera sinica TaxID=2665146 RepID=A0ABW1ALX3_9RHOO|nr:NAD(P)/FAD-dependent oxidoreductase [Thauera sp. K11]ATE60746.1 flavocytochrome C [Thauera sp. K11]